jgi:predicted nucleic acid-binding protein
MARDIFVDTSGFYSLLVAKDDQHEAASDILRESAKQKRRFITTDYVLDETATLLKARGHRRLLKGFFESVLTSCACQTIWTDIEVFSTTCSYFIKHQDQDWSFTDCVSFVVMRRERIREVLTKDAHFAEAGFLALLAK